jgi:hypothetical protein
MAGSESGRRFQLLNRNLITLQLVIMTVGMPLATHYAGRPLQQSIVPMLISAGLILALVWVGISRRLALFKPFVSLALIYITVELYRLNGGILNTSVEPALLSFGTAFLIALDGTVMVSPLAASYGSPHSTSA